MKNFTFKIIGIVLLSMCVAACASLKDKKATPTGRQVDMYMSETEQKEWYTDRDTIYHDSIAVAYVQNVEWEYLDGNVIRMEISLTSIRGNHGNTVDIFRYVHARQPKAKIEINTDEQFKLD